MTSLVEKWNQRFADAPIPGSACTVLRENLHLLPVGGSALDLACGLGGNAIALARHGLQTQAWDISDIALARLQDYAATAGLPLQTRCLDLSLAAPAEQSFDVIVVSYFLDRSLCAALVSWLETDGLLYYQTFTQDKISSTGPSNPDYLLRPGELLSLFGELELVCYREERLWGDLQLGQRDTAWLIGVKR